MNYKVYGLVNPNTKQIFYVGMTINDPMVRAAQHVFSNGVVTKYIKEHSIIPEIIVLIDGLTRKEALIAEKEEIIKRQGELINIRPFNRPKSEHPKHIPVRDNAKKVKKELVNKWLALYDNSDVEKIRKYIKCSRWEIRRAIIDGYFTDIDVVIAIDKFYAEREYLLSQYMD